MGIGEELRWRVMDMPNPALEKDSGECRHDAEMGCSWRCERRTGNAVTPEQVRDYIRERVGPALFAVLDGFGEELKSITMVGCEHADALAKADRTIATLRKALERYGRHKGDCAFWSCDECNWRVEDIHRAMHSKIGVGSHLINRKACDCGFASAALDEKGA